MESPLPKISPKDDPHFWREFFRVQTDKLLLIGLIVFLHLTHADERLQAAAVGGLVVLVQQQRFNWHKS